MNYIIQNIDETIKSFQTKPSKDSFNYVNDWYNKNKNKQVDKNYLICVYLFLLGSIIRHKYVDITYEQQKEWIKEIREYTINEDFAIRTQRIAYLNYGLKS